ncbi:hypothetical protein C9374_005091 [Naegleria lovaniensis]|uniref:ABC transporter domain-containing protein n=1 Tax=Naegleria lovaniensis TaxID=51637 RepID=A0AA88GNS3_NAELO|nr:uncharacterized protein C9374_005091 [Naegleria lovaniensis]KAG2382511.1 hypothetical protein C9374_005091 [Naegleria lovaniensis]
MSSFHSPSHPPSNDLGCPPPHRRQQHQQHQQHHYLHSLIHQTLILTYKNLKYKTSKPFQTLLSLTFPIQLIFVLWMMVNYIFVHQQYQHNHDTSTHHVTSFNNQSFMVYMSLQHSDLFEKSTIQEIYKTLQHSRSFSNIQYNKENNPIHYLQNSQKYLVDLHFKSSQDLIFINKTSSSFRNQWIDYSSQLYIQHYVNIAISNAMNKKVKMNESSIQIYARQFSSESPTSGSSSHGSSQGSSSNTSGTMLTLILSLLYPIYFSFSILNFFNPNLISIVTEKQSKLKSYMILMGCHHSSYILSYFISCSLEIIILMVMTFISLFISNLLKHVNLFLFCGILMVYLMSGIPLMIMTSTFFNDPKKALFLSQLLFMALEIIWIVYRFVLPNAMIIPMMMNSGSTDDQSSQYLFILSTCIQYVLYVLSPIAFCDMIHVIVSKYENQHVYFSWSSLFENALSTRFNSYMSVPPLFVMILVLIGDSILYLLIAIVLDKKRGESQSQSLLKFWKRIIHGWLKRLSQHWTGRFNHNSRNSITHSHSNEFPPPTSQEVHPTWLHHDFTTPSQIRIEHVSKTFNTNDPSTNQRSFTHSFISCFTPKTRQVVVLSDLTLNIKEGEITVFIGKNGVGKSTLVSLLSGQLKPESGNIYFDDLNVNDHIDEIRSRMGVCPQEDLIFPKLSVVDHLRIFAMIKSRRNQFSIFEEDPLDHPITPTPPQDHMNATRMNSWIPDTLKSLNSQIDHLLEMLEFSEFKYKDASTLSGGQKRKLSFAISIIGNPDILILDEVSTGVDIHNRQIIWNVLQQFRKQSRKIIILTTHQMEEADVLADEIHIMKNGNIEVSGTSLYLKNHYGIGYCIEMTLRETCCDHGTIEKIRTFFEEHFSNQFFQWISKDSYSLNHHPNVTTIGSSSTSGGIGSSRGGSRSSRSHDRGSSSSHSGRSVVTTDHQASSSMTSPYFTSTEHSFQMTEMNRENDLSQCKCILSNDLISQFPSFLKELSMKKEELGIASFMITQSTLEQVFLKLNPEETN